MRTCSYPAHPHSRVQTTCQDFSPSSAKERSGNTHIADVRNPGAYMNKRQQTPTPRRYTHRLPNFFQRSLRSINTQRKSSPGNGERNSDLSHFIRFYREALSMRGPKFQTRQARMAKPHDPDHSRVDSIQSRMLAALAKQIIFFDNAELILSSSKYLPSHCSERHGTV